MTRYRLHHSTENPPTTRSALVRWREIPLRQRLDKVSVRIVNLVRWYAERWKVWIACANAKWENMKSSNPIQSLMWTICHGHRFVICSKLSNGWLSKAKNCPSSSEASEVESQAHTNSIRSNSSNDANSVINLWFCVRKDETLAPHLILEISFSFFFCFNLDSEINKWPLFTV